MPPPSPPTAGERTRRWRQEKALLASTRAHGLAQGKVLAHLVKHTDDMLLAEVQKQRNKELRERVIQRREGPTLSPHTEVLGSCALHFDSQAALASVAPLRPRTATARAKVDTHDRLRNLAPNLPLSFLCRPAGSKKLEASHSREPGRALDRYQHLAREQPTLRFHLPYTPSFAEDVCTRKESEVPAELGADFSARPSLLSLRIPSLSSEPRAYHPRAAVDYLAFMDSPPSADAHRISPRTRSSPAVRKS